MISLLCEIGVFTWKMKHVLCSVKNQRKSPGWCDSAGWVSSYKPKGLGFNSQSGYIPEFLGSAPVGARARGHRPMFLLLPSPLSRINKRKKN